MKTKVPLTLRLIAIHGALVLSAFAQGTAFTYQGRLNDDANPANGIYDLQFAIYGAPGGGSPIAGPLTNPAIAVSNGIFTVTLDFGGAVFTGSARWLEVAVRTNGSTGAFTTLTPRLEITATPYALYAPSAGAAATATSASSVAAANITGTIGLSQLPAVVLTNNASGVNLTGSFGGNGSGLTNVPGAIPWQAVSGSVQSASPNQGYLLTSASTSFLTLPASANVGDVVMVSGAGSGDWQIAPGSGQIIVGHTDPAGEIWTAQPNAGNQWWASVASSADGSRLVAAANGDQIYTSTNSGVTWLARSIAGIRAWTSVACSADGRRLAAAVWNGRIYTSTNSGVTWAVRQSQRDWSSVASSTNGNKLVAVVSGGQIYTSSDAGVIWTARESNRKWQAVASSADGNKLVAVVGRMIIGGTPFDGQIYTSTDSGTTWTARESTRNWTGVASSADGSKLVAVVYGGQIYTSTNSGVTWTPRESNRNWQTVASSADGTNLVAAVWDGQIYVSTNSGVSWMARASVRQWSSVASSADASKLAAVVADGQIYTSGLTPLPLSGTGGASVRLQYIGNGAWQPLMERQIADSALSGNVSVLGQTIESSEITDGTIQPVDLNQGAFNTTFWRAGGNAGTTPGAHFLGTTDNQPLELRVNNQRALRIEPHASSPNVIGGFSGNFVAAGYRGSTIGGGGAPDYTNAISADGATIGGGSMNTIQTTASYSTIGGGGGNTIQNSAYQSTISGGEENTIQTNAHYATVGGGAGNRIQTDAFTSTISGGWGNTIQNYAYQSTIGGGQGNTIQTNAHTSTISGGAGNAIQTNAHSSTIGGGVGNTIQTNGHSSTIGGGVGNAIQMVHSTIGGGYSNTVSAYQSTIGGGYLNAIETNADFSSIGGGALNTIQAAHQSTIAGGYQNRIQTNAFRSTIGGGTWNMIHSNASHSTIGGGLFNTVQPNGEFAIIPGGWNNSATNYAFAAGRRANAKHTGAFVWADSTDADIASTVSNSVTMRASGGYRLYSGSASGVSLASGGGSWTSLSDAEAKENFAEINAREVLEKVAALPVRAWNYKSQDPAIRHLGPTAQDFKAAFGLGESDTGITSIDADGVALAAIQGLNEKLEEEVKRSRGKDARIALLEKQNFDLSERLTALESFIQSTIQKGNQ